MPAAGFRPSAEDLRVMNQLPGIRRALELYRLGLRGEGNREWLFTIRNLDDRQLLTAAEIARRHEIYDRAINAPIMRWRAARFPAALSCTLPRRGQAECRPADLDEAWVFGLIRQESRFIADAKSRVGASG